MNTKQKGDEFEERCFKVVKKASDIVHITSWTKYYHQKWYYSQKRDWNIIFDISAEIRNTNADKYSFVYLIECKNYKNRVPVKVVEAFSSKLSQVAQHNSKWIIMATNWFAKSCKSIAEKSWIALINVNENDIHSYSVYKGKRSSTTNSIDRFLRELYESAIWEFSDSRIDWFQKLSKKEVKQKVSQVLTDYWKCITLESIDSFTDYLSKNYSLRFEFNHSLSEDTNILWVFEPSKNIIYVDKSLKGTKRFLFVLWHELGHSFLHKNISFSFDYQKFTDSKYDFFSDRYKLESDKHRLERQANQYSVFLLLPEKVFIEKLFWYRESIWLVKHNHIYLDNQPINKRDYNSSVWYLSRFFWVSPTMIIHRMNELQLVTYEKTFYHPSDFLKEMFTDWLFNEW